MAFYSYPVADTLNNTVNIYNLKQEIYRSDITIALDKVEVTDSIIHVWFKDELPNSGLLDTIILNHSGVLGVLDTPDTIQASLTLEGRNVLARAKLGDIAYRQIGWQLGRGGYLMDNPVKLSPFSDTGSEALGYIDLIDNTEWAVGTYIEINGVQFIYNVHFIESIFPEKTLFNVKNAILDSKDPAHYGLIVPYIDSSNPTRLYLKSVVTGVLGNSFSVSAYHVGSPVNFLVSPMVGGVSSALEDAAWPVPPMLAPFSDDTGLIEIPSATALSFLTRMGDGIDGMAAYGELGIYVEVIESKYAPEVGSKILFARAHFPIQPKTDRSILNFRIIISF